VSPALALSLHKGLAKGEREEKINFEG